MKVGGAARRKTYDLAHRPRRLGLRPRDARDGRERGSAGGQMQKLPSVGKFHFVLHHCNSHNGLHCLPALNGATGSLGYFPECLTARSALSPWHAPTLPPTPTRSSFL